MGNAKRQDNPKRDDPKREDDVRKDRAPGIDPHGQRPMREGGERQPDRSDWREKSREGQHQPGQRQAPPSGPQPAEADPRQRGDRERETGGAGGRDRPSDPEGEGQSEATRENQRKSAYR